MQIPNIVRLTLNSILFIVYFFVVSFVSGFIAGFVGAFIDSINGYEGHAEKFLSLYILIGIGVAIYYAIKKRDQLFISKN